MPLAAAAGLATPSRSEALANRDLLVPAIPVVPPTQRAVLVLRYWEDLSDGEIAAILHCRVGTVRGRASRGLDRLRQVIGPLPFIAAETSPQVITMSDLESQLRSVMSASVAEARPTFTIADIKRGARRRRARTTVAAVAASAAVLAAVAGPVWLGRSFPSVGGVAPAASAGRYVDPGFGWSIRYPAGVVVQHFRNRGRSVAEGVRITTFEPDLSAASQGIPVMGWLRDFPSDGVAVQIWILQGPFGMPLLRDSRLPLHPSTFQRSRPYVGGSEPAPHYRSFQADGFAFDAAVWIGPEASNPAKSSAWAIIRSLAFRRLRAGTVWHRTFYVLGAASSYPVGAVTSVSASSLPRGGGLGKPERFYLLHYRSGFYAIKNEFADPARHYRTCPVTFDPHSHRFSCVGTGLHWDRNGLRVGAHSHSRLDQALQLHIATESQDGHILFSPFFGPAPRQDLPRVRR